MASQGPDFPLHVARLSALDLGFVRSPGPGLGNLLFPIARALIGCETFGGQFVYPTMRQIKFGTILRREQDLRTYGRVLRPRTLRDWLLWLRTHTTRSVPETAYAGGRQAVTVVYDGLGRHFHDLTSNSEKVRRWLLEARRADEPIIAPYDIALHVRLGDFTLAKSDAPTHNVRQEMEWYRSAFEVAKSITPTDRPCVRLFTDGDAGKVVRDLSIGKLEIDTSINALTAILNLSQARTIITSRSSFSMWGVYLGNAHAIWDRRFDLERSFPWREGRDERY